MCLTLHGIRDVKILRQNTDYAVRAMIHLAAHRDVPAVSTRQIASQEGIAFQFAGKIMQKLHSAGMVRSVMGPKGGFALAGDPSEINLLQIIVAIQGPIGLNDCLLATSICTRKPRCPVSPKLAELQEYIEKFLANINLYDLISDECSGKYCSRKGG